MNRRSFIKDSATLASGVALLSISNKVITAQSLQQAKKAYPFGLQLYTLRDLLPADPKGVLKKVAAYGYKQIESYEHDKLGMFWGMKPTDFKSFAGDQGLQVLSSHCDVTKDFERKAAAAAGIGMQYLICPWIGPQKSIDDYKKAAEDYNRYGEICRKNGIRFAYHNHDYSFRSVAGDFPQRIFLENTDKSLVDFEMDIYWVVTAGENPVFWLKKYPNRFRLVHVKDRMKNLPLTEREGSVTLGTGSIAYDRILKEAKASGTKHFIVEQEHYTGTTPLRATEIGAAYMRTLM